MKIALGVEYFGTNFHGWQIQENKLRTVQGVVELALSKVADHPVRVFCSGGQMQVYMQKNKLFILKLIQLETAMLGYLAVTSTSRVM